MRVIYHPIRRWTTEQAHPMEVVEASALFLYFILVLQLEIGLCIMNKYFFYLISSTPCFVIVNSQDSETTCTHILFLLNIMFLLREIQ
jgi:hypothetical protein